MIFFNSMSTFSVRGTCGGTGNQNCSYFESPNYPNYYPSDGGGTVVPTTEPPNGLTPDPRLHFYFSSRSLARQSNNALSCTYNVNKINNNIQQMRIDFIDLEVQQAIIFKSRTR